jgi:hypothetical protein
MRDRPDFFNPNFHEKCPQGHLYAKQLLQCPICYAPKTEEECVRCGHMERSHSPHSKVCLWTNCECRKFKASGVQRS